MEGYAAGKPAASADAGLAVLVSELTGLVGELAGAGPAATSFDEIEQITIEAAAGAPGFYPALARGQGQEEPGLAAGPLLISADCKGVAMLPGACRRRGAKAPGQRVRNFEKRRGTGEKGHKRMAQLGCVFDAGLVPRTPEQVMASKARAPGSKDPPRA